MARKFHMDPSL